MSFYGNFKDYVTKLMYQLQYKAAIPSNQVEIDWIFGHPELRLMNTTMWSSADRLSYETDMLSKMSFDLSECQLNVTAPVITISMKNLFQIVLSRITP